jgi:HEAT repeat protein
MSKRILVWFGVLVLVACGVILAMPGSRYTVLGYARQEPCFEGLPLSYYIHLLQSSRVAETRSRAAFVLGQAAMDGEPAVPALAEALHDPDGSVRVNAALALYKIGPRAHGAIPALCAALEDDIDWVRMDAAMSLSRLGPAAREAVPALVATLGRHNNRRMFIMFGRSVRQQAAVALGRIGPDAREAVPALTATLDDDEDLMREVAAEALRRINTADADHTHFSDQ